MIDPAASVSPIQPARSPRGCCSLLVILILIGAAVLVCGVISGAVTLTGLFDGISSGVAQISGGGEIEYGQTVSGNTLLAGSNRWTFTGSAGQAITVAMNADNDSFDTHLYLYDPDGREIARDDDSGPGLNSLLSCVRLPYNGRYAIHAAGYGDHRGSYQLTLQVTEADGLNEIEYGETVEGQLKGCPAEFTFRGSEDQLIRITADGSGFDGTLRLFDPNGNEIAYNDDTNGLDPELSGIFLPQNGVYRVVLADLGGDNNEGRYVLRLRLEEQ
jgi:hypothetical protein